MVRFVAERGRSTACRTLLALLLLAGGAAQGQGSAVSVKDLVETAEMSGLAVSPDGRRVAVRVQRARIDTNRHELGWFAVEVATGASRFLGSGGEAIYVDPGLVEPGEAAWSPGGERLYFRLLDKDAIGLWGAPLDGGGSRPLLVKPANIETIQPGGDGSLVYTVGPDRAEVVRAERHQYEQGVRVDARVDLSQSLMKGGWVEGRLAAQRLGGRWFSREGLFGREPRRRFRFDPATGADVPLGEIARPQVEEGPVLPDLRKDAVAGDGAVARADLAEGKARLVVTRGEVRHECEAPECRSRPISWVAWRPGRRQLVFAVRDAHQRDSLFLWDVDLDRVRRLATWDGTLGGGGYNADQPCAIGPADLVCIAAGPVSPPRLVALDFKTGGARELFDPNRRLRGKRMPIVRRLEWSAAPGVTTTGLLLTPANARPGRLPLFITYYRCLGFLKGAEGGEWPVPALVEAGFAVACINAAPSGESQDALLSYQLAQASIEALVAKLGREGVIDPKRVAMGGFSFGSEATMWMLARTKLIRAASIASPQIEPAYYWMNAMRGRDQPALLASVWGLGPPGTTAERWKLVSPAASSDKVDAPLLMQLSEQEARLDPELHARLSRTGVPVELYAFPDEAHFKVQPLHQYHAMKRNLDWFRYWMLGEVDPDPAKVRQYERWNALKERAAEPLPVP